MRESQEQTPARFSRVAIRDDASARWKFLGAMREHVPPGADRAELYNIVGKIGVPGTPEAERDALASEVMDRAVAFGMSFDEDEAAVAGAPAAETVASEKTEEKPNEENAPVLGAARLAPVFPAADITPSEIIPSADAPMSGVLASAPAEAKIPPAPQTEEAAGKTPEETGETRDFIKAEINRIRNEQVDFARYAQLIGRTDEESVRYVTALTKINGFIPTYSNLDNVPLEELQTAFHELRDAANALPPEEDAAEKTAQTEPAPAEKEPPIAAPAPEPVGADAAEAEQTPAAIPSSPTSDSAASPSWSYVVGQTPAAETIPAPSPEKFASPEVPEPAIQQGHADTAESPADDIYREQIEPAPQGSPQFEAPYAAEQTEAQGELEQRDDPYLEKIETPAQPEQPFIQPGAPVSAETPIAEAGTPAPPEAPPPTGPAERAVPISGEFPLTPEDTISENDIELGLQELVSKWEIFKQRKGLLRLLGIGPESVSYNDLAGLSMAEVLAGRWKGAETLLSEIKLYVDGWKKEQGVTPEDTETFDAYLHRVVEAVLRSHQARQEAAERERAA